MIFDARLRQNGTLFWKFFFRNLPDGIFLRVKATLVNNKPTLVDKHGNNMGYVLERDFNKLVKVACYEMFFVDQQLEYMNE